MTTSAHPAGTARATLPDFSAMLKVGQLRCIQSARETGERRNPDRMVARLLSPWQRWSCFWRGALLLQRLRADPFYYFVVARTRYYDQIFVDAIAQGVRTIINIGCGSDTRAYRYADRLHAHGVTVLECDQAGAIEAKQKLARRRLPAADVEYLSIDLNDGRWPAFEAWLRVSADPVIAGSVPCLLVMEGVSPYVDSAAFGAFMRLLAAQLPAGSRVAYDFKLLGVNDSLGRSSRTRHPFRLPGDVAEVAAYHVACGMRLSHFESSANLSHRLLPSVAEATTAPSVFGQDGLVQLTVPGWAGHGRTG